MDRFLNEMGDHLSNFLSQMLDLIPDLLVILFIMIAGFITAFVIRFILIRVFKALNFDKWSEAVGFSTALRNSRISSPPSIFISRFVFWFIVIIFLMFGFASLGLEVTNKLVALFFLYLPRFFSAIIIIVFGYFMAGYLGRAALLAAVNARIEHSRMIGEVVRLFLLILVFSMALEQLSIAPKIVYAAFSIFFGGVTLALAIAFGLGGREAARRIIEDIRKKREKDNIDHL